MTDVYNITVKVVYRSCEIEFLHFFEPNRQLHQILEKQPYQYRIFCRAWSMMHRRETNRLGPHQIGINYLRQSIRLS